jgi:hypothetical protein
VTLGDRQQAVEEVAAEDDVVVEEQHPVGALGRRDRGQAVEVGQLSGRHPIEWCDRRQGGRRIRQRPQRKGDLVAGAADLADGGRHRARSTRAVDAEDGHPADWACRRRGIDAPPGSQQRLAGVEQSVEAAPGDAGGAAPVARARGQCLERIGAGVGVGSGCRHAADNVIAATGELPSPLARPR